MCQHLTRGELQNQFEIFISSCKTGSETSFQNQDLCNYRVNSNESKLIPLSWIFSFPVLLLDSGFVINPGEENMVIKITVRASRIRHYPVTAGCIATLNKGLDHE